MRIDAHMHYWDVHRLRYFWMDERTPTILKQNFLPADLKPILQLNRMDGSIVVQASHTMDETWWLLELAEQDPAILGVVAWVDLKGPLLGESLDKLRDSVPFKGVRHLWQDEADDAWALNPAVIAGLKELAARNIPFDLCIHPRHLVYVQDLIEKIPDLRMVIDHMAKPFMARQEMEPWAQEIAALARHPKLYCKLSGMITEVGPRWKTSDIQPYLTHCLEQFGPTRCMFGSDWPVCLVAGTWKQTLAAFTQAAGAREVGFREKLMGLTAQEFYAI